MRVESYLDLVLVGEYFPVSRIQLTVCVTVRTWQVHLIPATRPICLQSYIYVLRSVDCFQCTCRRVVCRGRAKGGRGDDRWQAAQRSRWPTPPAYDDRSKKYGPGHDPLTGRHAAAFTAAQLELWTPEELCRVRDRPTELTCVNIASVVNKTTGAFGRMKCSYLQYNRRRKALCLLHH